MTINYYGNTSSNDGVIIILGTIFEEYKDKDKFDAFQNAIKGYNKSSLITIDFNDKKFEKDALAADLAPFLQSHDKTTIVIAIHGSQTLPSSEHYSLVGPEISNSLAATFLFGGRILSSDILASIGQAAGDKKVDVWQYTCQGGKFLNKALEYLPEGSTYVSEGNGFLNEAPFMEVFTTFLKNNQEIKINDLYRDYLIEMKYNHRTAINNDPVKVVVGQGEPVKSIEKADMLTQEIANGTLNEEKWSKVLAFYQQQSGFDLSKEIQYIIENKGDIGSFSNCVNQANKLDYFTSLLAGLIEDYFSWNDYSGCPDISTPGDEDNMYYHNLKAQVFSALGELYYSYDV